MKKMRKVVAMLLALAMVLGMSLTAFAANGKPEKSDTVEVSITGITEGATVKLYQIAEGEYGPGDKELTGYKWIEEGLFTVDEDENGVKTIKPTANEIIAVGYRLQGKSVDGEPAEALEAKVVDTATVGEDGVYKYTAKAGAYIAIISHNDEIYNPVLLSASYGSNGNLTTDAVSVGNVGDGYLYGTTAVAKKTTPDVDKTVEGGTPDDTKKDEEGNPIQTASVGDVLTYTVTPNPMPSYPTNANNKTFYIADSMTTGLTFLADSIVINVPGEEISGVKTDDSHYTFTNKAGTVIAKAKSESLEGMNGFNLNFDYDALQDPATGAVVIPVVTYKAVINEDAIVGTDKNENGTEGNENHVEMYYAKDPSSGSTWDPDETEKKPDGAEGVEKKEKKKVVYTYQVSFLKTKEDNVSPLANAIFGIYTAKLDDNGDYLTDKEGNYIIDELVDQVTTNDKGYAVSTNVAAGKYLIKELVAPQGYSLNTEIFPVEAIWTSATYEVSETVTDRTYSTDKPSDDAEQIGWILNGVFYEMDAKPSEDARPAYLASTNTTTVATGGTVTNANANGAGTALMDGNIPNTSLTALPSTGGIGTTIFTIAGCLIMIVAAGLFFASRRKSAK